MKQKINTTLIDYKYVIALISVFNFLLTPIHIAISGFDSAYVVVINFTIVIFGSSLIASTKIAKSITYVLGSVVLFFIWSEFSNGDNRAIMFTRLVMVTLRL